MNLPISLKAFYQFVFTVAFLLLCACSNTTQFTSVATNSTASPGKALIVVERAGALETGAIGIDVYDNLTLVGKLGAGGKLAWERDPGPMNLKLQHRLFNFYLGGPVNVKAGKTYRYNFYKKADFWGTQTPLWYLDGPGLGTVTSPGYSGNSPSNGSSPPAFDPSNPRSLQNQMLQQRLNEYSTLR